MTKKLNFTQILLVAIAFTVFLACKETNSQKNTNTIETPKLDSPSLAIDTFSYYPNDISGCACTFSNDSTEYNATNTFIYLDGYGQKQIAYMKINGVLTKFIQEKPIKESDKKTIIKAKSDNYDLLIEVIDGVPVGDEGSSRTGSLKLTDKNNQTISKTFYGVCSC